MELIFFFLDSTNKLNWLNWLYKEINFEIYKVNQLQSVDKSVLVKDEVINEVSSRSLKSVLNGEIGKNLWLNFA